MRERIVGWLSIAAICGAGLAVVGVRAPATARAQDQVAEAESAAKASCGNRWQSRIRFLLRAGKYDGVVRSPASRVGGRPAAAAAGGVAGSRPRGRGCRRSWLSNRCLRWSRRIWMNRGASAPGFSPEQIVIHTNGASRFCGVSQEGLPEPDGGAGRWIWHFGNRPQRRGDELLHARQANPVGAGAERSRKTAH